MTGKERRDYILTELMENDTPISASNFAKRLQVSRQVIVNDVALLRANNHVIEATNKGYKAYHIVHAPLNIASRLDVKKYLDNLKCGKSISLMTVTSGYHYHTICAETDERLDEIQDALSKLGYLAKLQEYEPVEF